jgi:hypothetical protein
VERTFGIVEKQWKILKEILFYPDDIVPPRIIHAAFALLNFKKDYNNDVNYVYANPLYNGHPIPTQPGTFNAMYYATNNEEAMR